MKRIIFYNLLIIMALTTGCRKIGLEPMDGKPVFIAEGKFDGIDKSWQAGVADYYLFSSFEKDALAVYEFTGSFAKKDSTGGEVLTFRIRDLKQLPQGLPDVTAAFQRDLFFASQSGIDTFWVTITDTVGWNTDFNAAGSTLPNTPVIYEWDFGDGEVDTLNQQMTTHNYDTLPTQPVTLTIRALNNSCASSLTKQLSLGGNTQACGLSFDLQLVNPTNPNSGLLITTQAFGNQPFSYAWSNGGNNFYTTIIDSIGGNVGASVTVTDAQGCTVSGSVFTTLAQGTMLVPVCIANFSNSPLIPETLDTQVVDTIIFGDSLQFSRVKIEYTDADGRFYSSFLGPQTAIDYIKILEVKDYDDNEKGEKTKKVSLEFTCRLWSEQGSFIDVSEGKAVIAVAYP